MSSSAELCLCLLLVAPFILVGYTLIHVGFCRARSAGYAGISSMIVISIAMLTYWAVGHPAVTALAGWAQGHHPISAQFVSTRDRSLLSDIFELYAVSLTVVSPLGAAADRWRLRALCISTAMLSGIGFPIFSHWFWSADRLSLAEFLPRAFMFDPGGAASIHVLGGLTALCIGWIVGPRRKKYPVDGPPAAIPAHNVAYVLIGSLLVTPGWIALNCAGAALYGIPASALLTVVLNTQLCIAAALVAALIATRVRYMKPDASLCANGWVAGLVASSAVCCVVSPWSAIFTGFAVGGIVTLCTEWLEVFARVDDPGGVICVHGVGGIIGLVFAGLFVHIGSNGISEATWSFWCDVLPQIAAISSLLGVGLPLMYGLNRLLDCFDGQRVDPANERKGMDLHELGGIAYPEFSLQPDD